MEDTATLLTNDHAEIDNIFGALRKALDKEDCKLASNLLDLLWARLAVHIRAENLCLFPTIMSAVGTHSTGESTPRLNETRDAITQLRRDHDFFMHELSGAVKMMRESMITRHDSPPPQELIGVRQVLGAVGKHLDSHNRLEEGQVYKMAALLLNEPDCARLAADVRSQIENLPPRLRARPP